MRIPAPAPSAPPAAAAAPAAAPAAAAASASSTGASVRRTSYAAAAAATAASTTAAAAAATHAQTQVLASACAAPASAPASAASSEPPAPSTAVRHRRATSRSMSASRTGTSNSDAPTRRARGARTPAAVPSAHESDANESYNSEDEMDGTRVLSGLSVDEQREREKLFERNMRKTHGLFIRRVKPDGACLFRATADQVYGDEELHGNVRRDVIEHMRKEKDHFSQFVTEDFGAYLARKSNPRCYGNNLEIQAISEVYGRTVEVYRYSTDPINIFQAPNAASAPPLPPIRLSYHRNSHYNSLRNPIADAALVPEASASSPRNHAVPQPLQQHQQQPQQQHQQQPLGATLADHLQVSEALSQSERSLTEQMLLEESRRQADLDHMEAEITAAAMVASLAELTSSLKDVAVPGYAATKSPASSWRRSKAKARSDDQSPSGSASPAEVSRPVSPTSSAASDGERTPTAGAMLHSPSIDEMHRLGVRD